MMEQQVVLITGASAGFGKVGAVALAENGFRVYGTSRKPGAEKPHPEVDMIELDVDRDDSVRSCVTSVLDRAGRIDILVNNAGYQLVGAIEETSVEEAKAQFETNFFGVVRMIHEVLPAMRKQRSGRIINIGSLAGLMTTPFSGFYTSTKFALEGFSEALRHELHPFEIHVSLMEPGFFSTGITDAMKHAVRTLDDYRTYRKNAVEVVQSSQRKGTDPRVFAAALLKIAQSPRPRMRYRIGLDSQWLPRIRAVVPISLYEWGYRVNFKLNSKG